MCEFQKTGHQKEVVLNLGEIFFFSEEKCTHFHCLSAVGLVMMKELCGHTYVPISPVLLNFDLIVQVQIQAICREGLDKDPENTDFLPLT